MKIIIDGMGGDNAPKEIVKGVVETIPHIEHEIGIVGREEDIRAALSECGYDPDKEGSRIFVVPANEVITNYDAPVKAVRTKKDSSMVVGLNMVKNGEGDLFISAGNSGALMAGGLFVLGRVRGIDRPAFAAIHPIMGGGASLIVDAGANAECKPNNLLEFGIMGSIYAEAVLGVKQPRVGLVNLGAEESKGTSLTKMAYGLLDKSSLNFVGNVEARDLPAGVCDVIVCDGFVGNVILKYMEGFALSVFGLLKQKLTASGKTKMAALMLKKQLKELKGEMDYAEYGGAPILGVRRPLIKMHGTSNAYAVKQAILKAIPFVENGVVETIENSVLEIEEIINRED